LAALGPLTFSAAAGDFVALVGPSGCGKSTLLRATAGLSTLTSGRIRIGGDSPELARLRRSYGIVFQSPVLYAWRTVVGNVELPLEIAGVSGADRRSRSNEVLRLVGLEDFAGRYPAQLSGGMQQRVALARALASRPRLLLMDEPFGALDEIRRERLNLVLLRLWRETGVTVLFVTHSIDEAVFLADTVHVLTPRPGRTAASIAIDLPRPREAVMRTTPAFMRLAAEVRRNLRESPGEAPVR
jgi:NitT/TauT family transport system ATP-binding protein